MEVPTCWPSAFRWTPENDYQVSRSKDGRIVVKLQKRAALPESWEATLMIYDVGGAASKRLLLCETITEGNADTALARIESVARASGHVTDSPLH